MITPASAIEMEEIAHQAEDYQKQSKEKKGFFGKIKLLTQGFHLINKAEKAEKGQNHKSQTQPEKAETVFEKHNTKILNQKKLLEYQETKNITNNNSQQTIPSLPSSCMEHATQTINFLLEQKISPITIETYNTTRLENKIAQIITPNGNIRYIEIININNNTVTVNTGTGNKEYTLDEFTKLFTGITLQTNNNDPQTVLEKINNKEQDDLNQENTQAHKIHDKAQNQVILWGVLIGVGFILLIIGIIMAVIFGLTLVGNVASAQKYVLTPTNVAKACPQCGYETNIPPGPLESVPSTPRSDIPQTPRNPNQFNLQQLGTMIESLSIIGCKVVAEAVPETTMHAISQNWIKVILCIIGLILVLSGLGLIITGIIQIIQNSKKWHEANKILRKNEEDFIEWNRWVNNTHPPIHNT